MTDRSSKPDAELQYQPVFSGSINAKFESLNIASANCSSSLGSTKIPPSSPNISLKVSILVTIEGFSYCKANENAPEPYIAGWYGKSAISEISNNTLTSSSPISPRKNTFFCRFNSAMVFSKLFSYNWNSGVRLPAITSIWLGNLSSIILNALIAFDWPLRGEITPKQRIIFLLEN